MKELSLLSPIIQSFDLEHNIVCKISHQAYKDSTAGVKLPVNYSVFMYLTDRSDDGRFILPIDNNAILGKKQVEVLYAIKSLIGHCSQIAELLFRNLKELNNDFKLDKSLEKLFLRYVDEKGNDNYQRLDFMSHRNLFSDIIKSKKIICINEIIKDYNIKSATKSFYNFILDRNKYTHGELMHWYPKRMTILEYELKAGVIEYGVVNQEVLNSYIQCYTDLNEIINSIKSAYSKKDYTEKGARI